MLAWIPLICLCSVLRVEAQETVKEYTLDECIRIGLERAVSVANAGRDEEIAQATVRQARAEAVPQLSARGAYTRLDRLEEFDIGSGPISFGLLDNYMTSVDISQLLYSGGKVRAALRAAASFRKYARLETVRARSALVRDIRTAFCGILLGEAAVEVSEESVKHLRDMVKQTQDKFDSGAAAEFDLLSAKVRLANETPRMTNARNALNVAREAFRVLVGIDDEDFALVGQLTFEPMDWHLKQLQKAGSTNRSEILALETTIDMLEQDIVAARSQGRPSARATFSYYGANSFNMLPFESDWIWHWTAGVVVEWSIFDGGLRSGTIWKKTLELEKARARLADFRKAVRLEIKQAYLQMVHARETIAGGEGTVKLAEKGRAIAKARYESGAGTALEHADANLALSIARLAYFRALRNHTDAVARLRYACGMEISNEDKN